MWNLTSDNRQISDANYIKALERVIGHKLPPFKTMEEAIYYSVFQDSVLKLPLKSDLSNLCILYKVHDVAIETLFLHSAIESKYSKNPLFEDMDSKTLSEDVMFLTYSSNNTKTNNLFIVTHGTKYKRYVSSSANTFVASAIITEKNNKYVKQLISLQSFKE